MKVIGRAVKKHKKEWNLLLLCSGYIYIHSGYCSANKPLSCIVMGLIGFYTQRERSRPDKEPTGQVTSEKGIVLAIVSTSIACCLRHKYMGPKILGIFAASCLEKEHVRIYAVQGRFMWLQVVYNGAVDLSSRNHMPSFLVCRGSYLFHACCIFPRLLVSPQQLYSVRPR